MVHKSDARVSTGESPRMKMDAAERYETDL
jgi:hypothetical protein